ncbi:MAG: hypothetical protein R6U66_13705 [Bacteroidales bacterium]
MKKNLFSLISIMLLSVLTTLGQTDMQRIYEANTLHWYGIDYSQTRFIGPVGFNEPERLQEHYFDAWNDVVNDEYEKYSLEEFFLMENVELHMEHRPPGNRRGTAALRGRHLGRCRTAIRRGRNRDRNSRDHRD